jgi:hypothetical protein
MDSRWGNRLHFGGLQRHSGAHTLSCTKRTLTNCPESITAEALCEEFVFFIADPRYGKGITAQYRLYDGGICMANLALALDALGLSGSWEPLPDADEDQAKLGHPSDLQPLAKIRIQSIGKEPTR